MRLSIALTLVSFSMISIACPTKPAVVDRPVVETIAAPPPVACAAIPDRPQAPTFGNRKRIVEPGSYRRLNSDGTVDGTSSFDVLPIETYLIQRSYFVELGDYYGAQSDAWEQIEACKRALGLPAPKIDAAPAFAHPDAAPCFSVVDGECFDSPPGTNPTIPWITP